MQTLENPVKYDHYAANMNDQYYLHGLNIIHTDRCTVAY